MLAQVIQMNIREMNIREMKKIGRRRSNVKRMLNRYFSKMPILEWYFDSYKFLYFFVMRQWPGHLGLRLALNCIMSCCTDSNECDPSLQVLAGTVALTATHATELLVARPGLFGQVISVVSATRSHIPTLNRFNLKVLKLDSKSNTLHTQWTAMNLI